MVHFVPMVFIQSQEYTNTFGKPSKNVICLEGQTDYQISFNEETSKYDVTIVMGDYHKYIFSAETEPQCTKILQNIFTHHSTKDPSTIYDVNAFMIPEIEQETTLEEIEEMVASLLEFHGYKGLVEAWDAKLDEVYLKQQDATSPIVTNEQGELCVVDNAQIVSTGPPQSTTTPPDILNSSIDQRYIHYN